MAADRWSPATRVEADAGLGRHPVRRVVRWFVHWFVFPGDTRAGVVRRVAMFAVGWGAVLALLLWSGYHQGALHGWDGVAWGAILTLLALVASRGWVRRPGPGGERSAP